MREKKNEENTTKSGFSSWLTKMKMIKYFRYIDSAIGNLIEYVTRKIKVDHFNLDWYLYSSACVNQNTNTLL